MSSDRVVLVVLAAAGIGVGAMVAKFSGVTSWLDAKLYISAGLVGGVVVGTALVRMFK